MDNADMMLLAVALYESEAGPALIEWRQHQSPNMDVIKQLASQGASAIEPLITVLHGYAAEMRKAVSLDLGVHHPRSQSPQEEKLVDEEMHRRISERWQNKCHGPAIALTLIGSEAVKPLMQEYKEADWLARMEIAWALGSIRDAEALPLLRSISAWWNLLEFPEVKRMASKAIELIRRGHQH